MADHKVTQVYSTVVTYGDDSRVTQLYSTAVTYADDLWVTQLYSTAVTHSTVVDLSIPGATVGVGHPTPPRWYPEWRRGLEEIGVAAQRFQRGMANNVGTFTLETSTTTTTVTDARVGGNTKIALSPTTANAAVAATSAYVSAVADGSFTVTHANNSQVDRTFDYQLAG